MSFWLVPLKSTQRSSTLFAEASVVSEGGQANTGRSLLTSNAHAERFQERESDLHWATINCQGCCLLQRLPLPRQEASSVLDLYSQHATYDTWVQTEPPGPGEARGDSADTAAREAGPWSSAGSQQNC